MVTYTSKSIGSRGWFKTTRGARQPRPYIHPLPDLCYGTVKPTGAEGTVGEFSTNSLGLIQGYSADDRLEARRARAAAYDKIIGRIRGEASAMLAVNAAEKESSLQMISKRANQLIRAVRAFRKFDIPQALTELGFKLTLRRREAVWVRKGKKRTHTIANSRVQRDEFYLRRKIKTASSLWLEYWLGWSPLISDIHGAVEVLQDQNFNFRNFVSGKGSFDYAFAERPPPFEYGGFLYTSLQEWKATFGCQYYCRIAGVSPNLKKANLLGVTNPATVAWELIPFSFIFDWFLPVGKFLESYTNLVGITIDRIIRMEKRTASYNSVNSYRSTWRTPPSSGSNRTSDTAFHFNRVIFASLPVPSLLDRRGTGLGSLTRAATAVSLLASLFKTSKW